MRERKKLLFVSPRFLFPVSTGGQIRTTQILKGMKNSEFEITLLSPAPPNSENDYKTELSEVCDKFNSWPETNNGRFFNLLRFRYLFSKLPIPVATDISHQGRNILKYELSYAHDIVVFDFPHSATLCPDSLQVKSVMFTHNVESEIFKRHVSVAKGWLRKAIWNNQYLKMCSYESKVLKRFDSIVAVSARDKNMLQTLYDVSNISVINTGVDLDYFDSNKPGNESRLVFTGSMDWYANIDGIEYFLEEIHPLIVKNLPDVVIDVVGRNPPRALLELPITKNGSVNFTNFVDDVRPYVYQAGIYVVPLRVGGGTRLKVFEAMAMGCPMVSTSIGVEGLPIEDGVHYLKADTPLDFAKAILRLNNDNELRSRLSNSAREYVENNFSHLSIAKEFESICLRTLESN